MVHTTTLQAGGQTRKKGAMPKYVYRISLRQQFAVKGNEFLRPLIRSGPGGLGFTNWLGAMSTTS